LDGRGRVGQDRSSNVMLEVGNCSNAYKSHDILAMEALMGSIQQPPPSSFSFRDLSWWVGYDEHLSMIQKQIPYGKGCMCFTFHGLGF